jgi:uncharacterized membrane protein HdeD (DUF308 family)
MVPEHISGCVKRLACCVDCLFESLLILGLICLLLGVGRIFLGVICMSSPLLKLFVASFLLGVFDIPKEIIIFYLQY